MLFGRCYPQQIVIFMSAPTTTKDYLVAAQTAVSDRRNQDAITLLNKALELDANNVDALIVRGEVHKRERNFDAAKSDFAAASTHRIT